MKKGFLIFALSILTVANADAVNANYVPKKFNTVTSHDDVYPYRLNNTKTNTNARDISANSNRRAVVPRTSVSQPTKSLANQNTRRVVQRTNTSGARVANTATMRSAKTPMRTRNAMAMHTVATNTYTTPAKPSSQRCFADYKECMENYCQRENTPYNRCYCSAKLAQIDAKYQNKIDELIQQIIQLQYDTHTTSDEIRDYWDQTVGVYTKDNPWVNIDNALNIEWADTESRVRGQNAFNTGHQYCSQNLRACYYMASNLRDAYKSEITRDCEAYEKSLQKIKATAESVIESYHD